MLIPLADSQSCPVVQRGAGMHGSLFDELNQTRKEIRLIILESGGSDDPVTCSFETISLLEPVVQSYETISYVWGNTVSRNPISVSGHQLDVPTNVESVLKRFRYPNQRRRLWIDAVCINQHDTTERNYQVEMMDEIYSCARSGLIWLGEDPDAALIFNTMDALEREASAETEDFSTFKEVVWPGWWDVYRPATAVQIDAEKIFRLIDCAWFRRLWIVQEAALPTSSFCYLGDSSMPLLKLLRAIVWLYSKNKSLPSPLSGHTGLARAVHIASYCDPIFKDPFQSETNLLWMLNTLQQYDTTESKDHIYGLLGMYRRFARDGRDLPRSLSPNYDRPIQDIFSDACRLAMAELKKLDALIYVCHRNNDELRDATMPTWVPRWNRQRDPKVDALSLNYSDFDASGCMWHSLETSTSGNRLLEVQGYILDRIHAVTDVFAVDATTQTYSLLSLLTQCRDLAGQSGTSRTRLSVALVASLNHKRQIMTASECEEGYSNLLKALSESDPDLPIEIPPESIAARNYHEALNRWTRNRRFFVTATGRVGIGPRIMQADDTIAILQGSSWPIVLRQHSQRIPNGHGPSHAVIGQAYVHGVMFGEASDPSGGGSRDIERREVFIFA